MFLRLSKWVKKSGSPNFQPPWIKISPYFPKNWGGGSWFLQGWWFVNVCDLHHRRQSDRNGPSFAEVLEYVASLNRRSVRLEINWGMLRKMQCISSVVSYDRYGRLQESIVCFCLNIVTIPPIKKTLGGYTSSFRRSNNNLKTFAYQEVPSFATLGNVWFDHLHP